MSSESPQKTVDQAEIKHEGTKVSTNKPAEKAGAKTPKKIKIFNK